MPFGIALPAQFLWYITFLTLVFLAAALALTLLAVVIHLGRAREARRWVQLEARWEPVVFDVIAGDVDPRELTSLVQPRDQRLFVDYLLRLSKRVRGRERDQVTQLARRYLPLVGKALTHRNPEIRARAIATLGELGADAYDTELAAALNDGSLSVAFSAAQALTRRRSQNYATQLLDAVERFAQGDTRYVASMLARVGPTVAPVLRQALGDRARHPRTRAVIAEALTRLNDLPSADIAADIIRSGRDTDLLVAALRLISNVGNAEHLDAVRPLLASRIVAVRGLAVSAVAQLGDASDIGRVTAALSDNASWVVARAARGLLALGATAHARELAASTGRQAVAVREALSEARG